jgi:hypothetical protein
MKIIATHSHFNGLEFVHTRKKALWNAFAAIVRSLNSPDSLGHKLSELLTAGGWCREGVGNVELLTKSGIAVNPFFEPRGATLDEQLNCLVASYRRSEFDICVLVFAERQGNSAILDDLVGALARNGRSGFGVPLILMSIGSAATTPARKVPTVGRVRNSGPVEKSGAAARLM